MLKYTGLTKACRSVYIGRYFGDMHAADCGVCDNCLHKRNTTLSTDEFKKIESRINKHIPESGIAVKQLLLQAKGIKKERFFAEFHLQKVSFASLLKTGKKDY